MPCIGASLQKIRGHSEFGVKLPPFTSLLKICLTHPKE